METFTNPDSTINDNYASADKPIAKSKEEIQAWLVNQVAGLIFVDPKTVDILAPFNSFGLSSRDAIMLSGDLEEWLNRRLSPTLLYEYPTISTLADYLSGSHIPDPAPSAGNAPTITWSATSHQPGQQADEKTSLDDLEQLSDDEAEELLMQKLEELKSKQ